MTALLGVQVHMSIKQLAMITRIVRISPSSYYCYQFAFSDHSYICELDLCHSQYTEFMLNDVIEGIHILMIMQSSAGFIQFPVSVPYGHFHPLSWLSPPQWSNRIEYPG